MGNCSLFGCCPTKSNKKGNSPEGRERRKEEKRRRGEEKKRKEILLRQKQIAEDEIRLEKRRKKIEMGLLN